MLKNQSPTMGIFKEFLESSTIHGLVYISTSKATILKLFWSIIVVIAFGTALKLISNSYMEWNIDPVSTSVSTHPIEELDFPTITICPPTGYNTALNYDLVQAGKLALTKEDRINIVSAARKAFLVDSYNDFSDLMLAVTNPTNIEAINSGLQRAPTLYSQDGFEVTSWSPSGSISTPWFGQKLGGDSNLDQLFYKTNHSYHYILDMRHIPSSETLNKNLVLVLEIEVNTRMVKLWKEIVQISEGAPKSFKYYSQEMKWEKIDQYCIYEGGRFASILTEEEQTQAESVLPSTRNTRGSDDSDSWIGGTIDACQITWLDGSPASSFDNFEKACTSGSGEGKQCLKIEHTLTNNTKYWTTQNCEARGDEDEKLFKKSFLCQFESVSFTEPTKKTIKLPFEASMKIELWWNYTFQGQFLLDNWTNKTMTGFNMTWHVEDNEGQKVEIRMPEDSLDKNFIRERTETRMFGDLVQEKKRGGSDLVAEVIEEKAQGIEGDRIWYLECTEGPITELGRDENWTIKAEKMNINFNPESDEYDSKKYEKLNNLSRETLISGLKLRSAVLFCPLEGIEMYQFFRKISNSTEESAADIFHAVLNTLSSGEVMSSLNIKSLNRFFKNLETMFNLQLGKIMVGLSSLEELELLLERRAPYLENFEAEIANCRRDEKNCAELEKVARTLPGEAAGGSWSVCFVCFQ